MPVMSTSHQGLHNKTKSFRLCLRAESFFLAKKQKYMYNSYEGDSMQFGFTSNTFRNIKDLEKIVKIATDIGADCIEWSGDIHVTDEISAEKAKALCDKAGISICAYGSYYRVGSRNSEEWKGICRIAHILKAPVIRVWLGSHDSEKTDDETYDTLVSDLKAMCDDASEYGISVCPECHDNTYNNNTDAFLKIRKDTDKENFCTYFQSRYRKLSYDLDRIIRTAPFIKCVHVSFFDMRREQFPSYDGTYMKKLVKKLAETGYDNNLIIEFTYPGFKAGYPFFLKKHIVKLKSIYEENSR